MSIISEMLLEDIILALKVFVGIFDFITNFLLGELLWKEFWDFEGDNPSKEFSEICVSFIFYYDYGYIFYWKIR